MNRFFIKVITKINLWFINHFLCGQRCYGFKRTLLRACNVKVGKGTKIVGPIYFGTAVSINIGSNTFINHDFSVEGNGTVTIGDNCDFAPFVSLFTGGHQIGIKEHRAGNGLILSVAIGNGCWVGARSSILGNVIVGDGAVIGLGTVVIRDVANDTLVCGVPAEKKKDL